MCKVIAISNQKGGCGKTSVTANLGVGLAMAGKKVCLIDADPQGSLTISLGYPNPDEIPLTLATIMMTIIDENELPEDFGILHHKEGVDLMRFPSRESFPMCMAGRALVSVRTVPGLPRAFSAVSGSASPGRPRSRA